MTKPKVSLATIKELAMFNCIISTSVAFQGEAVDENGTRTLTFVHDRRAVKTPEVAHYDKPLVRTYSVGNGAASTKEHWSIALQMLWSTIRRDIQAINEAK